MKEPEIRKRHELTHFVCRSLFQEEKKNLIWDALLADCVGLLLATEAYSLPLVQAFLGIENGGCIGGGLKNHTGGTPDGSGNGRAFSVLS